MKLLGSSILNLLFRSKAESNEVAPITAAPAKQEVFLLPEWADDTQLRELAEDYRNGLTKWGLAGDMAEFYKSLDLYNSEQPEDRQVKLQLLQKVSDVIQEYRDKKLHLESEIPPNATGTIVLSGELGLRYLGPQSINENLMRFEINGQTTRARYYAGPENTNISILTKSGWKKFEFGMGETIFSEISPAPAALPDLTP